MKSKLSPGKKKPAIRPDSAKITKITASGPRLVIACSKFSITLIVAHHGLRERFDAWYTNKCKYHTSAQVSNERKRDMGEKISLSISERTVHGKKFRNLRADGITP